jgi:hypothetical protein
MRPMVEAGLHVRGIQMNNLEPTDMNETVITDLIDMVRKRMGIDLEYLGANPASNFVSGSTFAIVPPARHATNPSAHL